MVWASTLAGGAGGWWAVAQLGARYGMNLGPWAGVAGGMLGAVAGATLGKKLLEAKQAPLSADTDTA